jgi:hypothetical protein
VNESIAKFFTLMVQGHLNKVLEFKCKIIDTPPNSLKNSNANAKMKTTKEKINARSLTHNTSEVKGECWSSKM